MAQPIRDFTTEIFLIGSGRMQKLGLMKKERLLGGSPLPFTISQLLATTNIPALSAKAQIALNYLPASFLNS